MLNYALVIDYKYCTGCHTCEVACSKEKGLPAGQWGIKLSEQGPVEIEGKYMWNYIPIPSDCCDLCMERIEEGKKPACVHHCLAFCMEAVPVEDISKAMIEKGNGAVCFIPNIQG